MTTRVLNRAALWLIRFYQLVLSPFLGGRCRFVPSCSHYAAECFECHSSGRALWLSAKRVARCHPLGGHGYDPVPPAAVPKL